MPSLTERTDRISCNLITRQAALEELTQANITVNAGAADLSKGVLKISIPNDRVARIEAQPCDSPLNDDDGNITTFGKQTIAKVPGEATTTLYIPASAITVNALKDSEDFSSRESETLRNQFYKGAGKEQSTSIGR